MKVLGIVVGVVIVLWILLKLFLMMVRRKLKGALVQIAEGVRDLVASQPPPPRIELEPDAEPNWRHPQEVEDLSGQFAALGFADAGAYGTNIFGVQFRAFCKPDDAVYAVVYDHWQAGVWADVVVRLEDGRTITASNAPRGRDLDHRPTEVKVYVPEPNAAAMIERAIAQAGDASRKPTSPDEFAAVFTQHYADEMDWLSLRGGRTEDEIRRVAAETGDEVDDEALAMLREREQVNAAVGVSTLLAERFASEQRLSKDEEARLFVVHDRLIRDSLMDKVYDLLADAAAIEAAIEAVPPDITSAREAFHQFNEALPEDLRLEKLGELSEPVGADVYLAPGIETVEVEDEDEFDDE